MIPAFNQTRLSDSVCKSISTSLTANYKPRFTSETIVVDNNSTDNTAELARQAGARVVFEPVNQIGRARNAGAAQAAGDWLLFIDADSLLNPGLLADILRVIEEGKQCRMGKRHPDGRAAVVGKLDVESLDGRFGSVPLGSRRTGGVPYRRVSRCRRF